MSKFKKINNMKELQSEKGLYYPYLMQMMGAPVIKGVLIPATTLKYMYSNHIEGMFQNLMGIYCPNPDNPSDYSNKLFKKISRKEFIYSMTYVIADCFYDGCDPEDFNEDKMFEFLDSEERYEDVLVD